ncbi:MAG: DUF3164 family protein [Desulfovibrionaceae bacterium]|nr:DUF3164 family protein [Desulfovibrionaceae bacterium]
MTRQVINGVEYMQDGTGNLVAVENIRPIDLAEDELVKEIAAEARKLHIKMRAFKDSMMDDIGAFIQMSAERYDVKLGGTKGNVTLESFDGRFQVQRQIAEHITFDAGLQAAKALIDECLRDWSKDTGPELRTLVTDAFRVDKQGKLNTGAILGLRRHKFDDDRWQRAMQAISDSVRVTGTRAYVRVYERDERGGYHAIPLDMAAL